MNISRRSFLKTSLGAAAAMTAIDSSNQAFAQSTPKRPIGLQLYAVRGEFERDVPGTLKTVRALGYNGVEFWGYGGTPNVFKDYSAKQLKTMLDDTGLKCCGMHIAPQALDGDNLSRTVENNKILDNPFMIVAGAADRMASKETIAEFAKFLNQASEKVSPQDMFVGYHAHGFDFAMIDGRFAWDHLFSQTRKPVVMQMDVGNCLGGGGDPIAMLKKFPGRSLTVHIKEYEDKTFESQYYTEVFGLCENSCATQCYIVEMGGDDGNGFDISGEALEKLRKLGK